MSKFHFNPAPWIPFRDTKELERVRNIKRADYEKHWNPDFKIRVVPNPVAILIADVFTRIKESDEQDKKLVMVFPNPWSKTYQTIGTLINRAGISCRNVHAFAMDEFADENGNVAPITYRSGLGHAFQKYFYGSIDPALRMPENQFHYLTNENYTYYSDLIDEAGDGGADVIYAACGWPGHTAFIDPDTEAFHADSVEVWKQLGSRFVVNHPLSVVENSLFPVFGSSGDVANVPYCSVTIGPRDIQHARLRFDIHSFAEIDGVSSWQRMASRLAIHGPVSMQIPMSFDQELRTDVFVSEEVARDIEISDYM